MAKKKSATKMAATGTAKKKTKNSLVGNINRRKRSGTSRSKEESTISDDAYRQMENGWPKKKTRKTS